MSAGESKQASGDVQKRLDAILAECAATNAGQADFLQAAEEIARSLLPLFEQRPRYLDVFATILEPEQQLMFRVPWVDDNGQARVNRGYRIQVCTALGPSKGGLRFHPSVTLSTIKFLGLEQCLKNALTTLSLGGGKGGSDFDPKGKSEAEIHRFCVSFMTALAPYISEVTDVPAGDIGVGGREIGFLFGHYKRMTKIASGGVLTGKGVSWGGSHARTEATGFGLVYLTSLAVQDRLGTTLKGLRCLVSGSGNVAQYCAAKLLELGAKVITMSDSGGTIVEQNGLTNDQLKQIMQIKANRGRIEAYAKLSKTATFHAKKKPWQLFKKGIDAAFPCATQNEIDIEDAKALCAAGMRVLAEGANMPSTNEAVDFVLAQRGKKEKDKDKAPAKGKKSRKLPSGRVLYLPAKAANSGGVATSGLEMAQNGSREQWTFETVDNRLQGIMARVYESASEAAEALGQPHNLQLGANAAGFIRVADAMIQQGQVPPAPSRK